MGTEYVQAWEWSAPGRPGGYAYTPQAALDRVRDGYDVQAVTIVRHADGSREYLRGTLAHEVRRFRTAAP